MSKRDILTGKLDVIEEILCDYFLGESFSFSNEYQPNNGILKEKINI